MLANVSDKPGLKLSDFSHNPPVTALPCRHRRDRRERARISIDLAAQAHQPMIVWDRAVSVPAGMS
jgi:hypothetical protein